MFNYNFSNVSTVKLIDNGIGNSLAWLFDTNTKNVKDLEEQVQREIDRNTAEAEVERLVSTLVQRENQLAEQQIAFVNFQSYFQMKYKEQFVRRTASSTSSVTNDAVKDRLASLRKAKA